MSRIQLTVNIKGVSGSTQLMTDPAWHLWKNCLFDVEQVQERLMPFIIEAIMQFVAIHGQGLKSGDVRVDFGNLGFFHFGDERDIDA